MYKSSRFVGQLVGTLGLGVCVWEAQILNYDLKSRLETSLPFNT